MGIKLSCAIGDLPSQSCALAGSARLAQGDFQFIWRVPPSQRDLDDDNAWLARRDLLDTGYVYSAFFAELEPLAGNVANFCCLCFKYQLCTDPFVSGRALELYLHKRGTADGERPVRSQHRDGGRDAIGSKFMMFACSRCTRFILITKGRGVVIAGLWRSRCLRPGMTSKHHEKSTQDQSRKETR